VVKHDVVATDRAKVNLAPSPKSKEAFAMTLVDGETTRMKVVTWF
jgi:hypothetical protein